MKRPEDDATRRPSQVCLRRLSRRLRIRGAPLRANSAAINARRRHECRDFFSPPLERESSATAVPGTTNLAFARRTERRSCSAPGRRRSRPPRDSWRDSSLDVAPRDRSNIYSAASTAVPATSFEILIERQTPTRAPPLPSAPSDVGRRSGRSGTCAARFPLAPPSFTPAPATIVARAICRYKSPIFPSQTFAIRWIKN